MGSSVCVDDTPAPVKISFSFFPADVAALKSRVRTIERAGVTVRHGTVLRALIHQATPADMIAHVLSLFGEYAQKEGPREDEPVTGHPTVDLPVEQVEKLDGVISALARRGLNTTRTFAVRALLRASPEGKELVTLMKKFLVECPPKPSGWAARKAREHHG